MKKDTLIKLLIVLGAVIFLIISPSLGQKPMPPRREIEGYDIYLIHESGETAMKMRVDADPNYYFIIRKRICD